MGLKETEFVCVDVETTGRDPEEDRVIEVAAWRCMGTGERVGEPFVAYVNPQRPIPPESSAVHHITDEDVEGAGQADEVIGALIDYMGPRPWLAHNIGFDAAFLGAEVKRNGLSRTKSPAVCTLRLAKHLMEEAPNHKLQTLKYFLKLSRTAPHRAEGDVQVCCELFGILIERYLAKENEDSVEALMAFANRPAPVHVMPLGKHRGTAIEEIPMDYLEWVERAEAFKDDRDLKHALGQELERRRTTAP